MYGAQSLRFTILDQWQEAAFQMCLMWAVKGQILIKYTSFCVTVIET